MATTTAKPTNKLVLTLRLPRPIAEEVRRIAARDCETTTSIIRRLLRIGIAEEHRGGNEAA